MLLRRRPPDGLLGGMTELPGTPWRAETWTETEALAHAPMPAPWRRAGQVRHGFTHFQLAIELFAALVPEIEAEGYAHPVAALGSEPLPSVMRKCVTLLATPVERAAWPRGPARAAPHPASPDPSANRG